MAISKKKLLTTLVALIPLSGFSVQDSFKNAMLENLDTIKNTFEVKYAPNAWKNFYLQWNLEREVSLIKDKVLNDQITSVRDFQRALTNFFNSAKDYHVGIQFYNTEAAFLPFRVKSADGRYFVVWSVDNTIAVGDEIIAFDNKPINDAVAQVKKSDLGNPESNTDQELAEIYLTARIAGLGHEVPNGGEVPLSLKSAGTGAAYDISIPWLYFPEEISDGPFKAPLALKQTPKRSKKSAWWKLPLFTRPMACSFYNTLNKAFKKINTKDGDSANPIGDINGPLPDLGTVIWRAPLFGSFRAYLFTTPDNKNTIGYIRIPSFDGDDATAVEFANIISVFELYSDGLIIDQLDNPGGNVFYLYGLASMLSPTQLKVPAHRFTITQEDVMYAIDTLDQIKNAPYSDLTTIYGYPIDQNFMKSLSAYLNFIIDQWNSGNNFTDLVHFYGIHNLTINPRIVYTKPITVLVNSLDFSAADFFPAILQDNKRATIVGEKTAGAGGIVLSDTYHNLFGIASYSFTGSIAKRFNTFPIENLGVTPDVSYSLTPIDLQNNYSDFSAFILKTIQGIIPPQT